VQRHPLESAACKDSQPWSWDEIRQGSGRAWAQLPVADSACEEDAGRDAVGTDRARAGDRGSIKDFQAFARQTGNELLGQGETADKAYEFFLKRK
jgi:hypothetical protein